MLKNNNAFTLMELFTVLAVLAILLIMVIPTMHSLIERNQSVTQINQLVSAIHLARTEAIKRGSNVSLCKSVDHKSCSGDWADGQIVFVDRQAKGRVQNEADIIRIFLGVKKGARLFWRGFVSNDYLVMQPKGIARSMSGRFIYQPANKDKRFERSLVISQAGRVRLDA